MTLRYTDHRSDPAAWAASLGVSPDAVALYLDSDVIDLHNDVYVPARVYGYDVHREHRPRLFGARFFGQSDLPRLREAALTGVVFDIATNPARRGSRRAATALRNIARVVADLARHPEALRLVTTAAEYDAARADGVTACWIGIQGGQAFQHDRAALEAIPDTVHRITLVHLTNSRIGETSSPLGRTRTGLTDRGRELIERMNARRILVDLAHICPEGFWKAVAVHDRTQPLICTHTGVTGVHPHWRNVDDAQIRAVSETGGTVGIIFQSSFLAPGVGLGRCAPEAVVDHIAHAIAAGGEEHVSIGTDYDGLITPPHRLREVPDMPVLVQLMRDRGVPEARIRRVLGGNALRVIRAIRP